MLVSDSAHKSTKQVYKSINKESAKFNQEGFSSVEKVKEQMNSMINRPHQSSKNFSALSMKSVEKEGNINQRPDLVEQFEVKSLPKNDSAVTKQST